MGITPKKSLHHNCMQVYTSLLLALNNIVLLKKTEFCGNMHTYRLTLRTNYDLANLNGFLFCVYELAKYTHNVISIITL